MKVALLGPNGQLGRDILDAHRKSGEPFDLVPLARMPETVKRALTNLDFDVLVNCTGYHRTDEVEDSATLAFAVNAHAVQAMAQACASRRARLLHISTDYVFGGDAGRTSPLREDDPTAPVNIREKGYLAR